MGNNVEKFLSEVFGEVRAFKDEKSKVWLHANDIMTILEYSEGSMRTKISRLNKKGVTKKKIQTNGGLQLNNFIDVDNTITLILGSKIEKNKKQQILDFLNIDVDVRYVYKTRDEIVFGQELKKMLKLTKIF